MTLPTCLLAAQAIASGMMAGVIWFVQVIHYPLFAVLDARTAAAYADDNRRRTAWLVLPVMSVEAVTAVWLVLRPPAAIGRGAATAGLAMLVLLWLSTLAVQMPLHARLAREGNDPATVATLVRSNWPRTILWTARAAFATWMLAAAG